MVSARLAATAFCAVIVSASIAHAQYTADGFNPGTNGLVRAIAVQPDGKVLIGGDFTMSGGGATGGTTRAPLVRLNADGTVDAGFADSIPSDVPTAVYGLLIQPRWEDYRWRPVHLLYWPRPLYQRAPPEHGWNTGFHLPMGTSWIDRRGPRPGIAAGRSRSCCRPVQLV